MLTTVLDSYRRHRFAWLFFSLLFTLGAHPALEALVSGFNPLERGLAILEAVSGQMYLTVLVARLVSLYAKQADE